MEVPLPMEIMGARSVQLPVEVIAGPVVILVQASFTWVPEIIWFRTTR